MAAVNLTVDQLADLYRKAFDHVCNKQDWRAGINCTVPWDVANIYIQAIEFMTGVAPECVREFDKTRYVARITCIGYRNGPCGG